MLRHILYQRKIFSRLVAMNSFDTLFFPETAICSEKRYPLLVFFTPLHFVQIVETGPGPLPDSEAELFLKRGLCQAHTPAPLGSNRGPFLRLIQGIGEQKESLISQFTQLTTASRSALTGNEPQDTRQSIVTSLLRQYGVEHATTEKELQLWQARLVLAMAEILDSHEDALRERLFAFSEEEIAAFRALQGETDPNEEDPFSELASIMGQLENTHAAGTAKRFAAWLRLLQNQPVPPVKVWLASTREAATQIFDKYRSVSNVHAVPLYKLALPAQIAASGKYALERIEEFQQATIPIHQGIAADFQRIGGTIPYLRDVHASLLPYGTDWAEQWQGALDVFFPAANDGRQDVTFYLLPDQPLERLLSLPKTAHAAQGESAHGLLALLGPAQAS
jgi:hypothetical protein